MEIQVERIFINSVVTSTSTQGIRMDIEGGKIIIEKKIFSDADFEKFTNLYLDAITIEERSYGNQYEIQIINQQKKVEIIKFLYSIWSKNN